MRAVAVVLCGFALIALLLGWSRWLARRRLAAMGHWLAAGIAATSALFVWPLLSDLSTYDPMTREATIAELHFEQTGSRRFRATLVRLPSGRTQVFELTGDQWRIDARTLEWQGTAAELGIRPAYRLERLATRHVRPAADEAASEPSSFELAAGGGTDLWARSRSSARWARHVSGRNATGPWKPMANGARYVVRMGDRALNVAAENEAASSAAAPP